MSPLCPHVSLTSLMSLCVYASPVSPMSLSGCPTNVPYGAMDSVPIHTLTHIGDIGDINNLIVRARGSGTPSHRPQINLAAALGTRCTGTRS
jgi:hypothetical protein